MFIASNTMNFSMDTKLLLSSPNTSISTTSLPFFLSYKSPFLHKPKISVLSCIKSSKNQSLETSFWGKGLILPEKGINSSNLRKNHVRFEPVRAVVKRRKENSFDTVIERDKKLKLVLKIRKILVSQPDRIMSLRELGKYRKELGLTQKRRFIALLKKYPAVFEIVEEGVYSLKFKLTPEAEKIYLEELRYKNGMEDLLVTKLRKLLMMSLDKRILLEKITHIRTDLGLPLGFRDTICQRYPQFFKVVVTGRGPALELTEWDPELAVSAAELAEEENKARELKEGNLIIDRPLKFKRVKLPKGLNLSKGEMRRVSQFKDMPYISPYSDFSELKPGTLEKEKHACGVIHEMLSLTNEKRTLVDHLTHFREEFRFSQQLRGMLIRHPDMFYVSLKGVRDSVFLREAYRDSQLIEKDKLLLFKEKLRALVAVPRFSKNGRLLRRGMGRLQENDDDDDDDDDDNDVVDDDDGSEEEEEGDDEDDVYDDDDDGDYEDDWSDDEDDETPPDFDEDDDGNTSIGSRKEKKRVNGMVKNEDKPLDPVFPDGRPRERW